MKHQVDGMPKFLLNLMCSAQAGSTKLKERRDGRDQAAFCNRIYIIRTQAGGLGKHQEPPRDLHQCCQQLSKHASLQLLNLQGHFLWWKTWTKKSATWQLYIVAVACLHGCPERLFKKKGKCGHGVQEAYLVSVDPPVGAATKLEAARKSVVRCQSGKSAAHRFTCTRWAVCFSKADKGKQWQVFFHSSFSTHIICYCNAAHIDGRGLLLLTCISI